MKKLFILIIIIVFFCLSNIKSFDYDYLINDDSYDLYTLYFDGLNTSNFVSYFSGIDVVRIYPYINPIYSDMIGNLSYKVGNYSLSYEIENFSKSYLSLIKKNSYLDYNYLYLNGINIASVDVYMSGNDLYNFISNCDLVIGVK